MVVKFVSMPPSHRWLTYGALARRASSSTASCACFLVPTKRMVPPEATTVRVRYLRERFGVDKVYLVGESWGSALGIMLVQRYPELFHALVGTGQMVAFLENDRMCYDFALNWARERGDTQKVEALTRQGPPPYYGKDVAWQEAAFLMDTFNYMNENPAIADNGANTFRDLAAPEYGLYDKVSWFRGVLEKEWGELQVETRLRQVSEELRNAITWMNETRGERYMPPLWTRPRQAQERSAVAPRPRRHPSQRARPGAPRQPQQLLEIRQNLHGHLRHATPDRAETGALSHDLEVSESVDSILRIIAYRSSVQPTWML